MKYEFNHKRLALLSVCLVLLIMLSFAAGLVTGIGLWMPTREEIALLKRRPVTETARVSAPQPGPPPLQSAPPVGGPEPAKPPVVEAAAAPPPQLPEPASGPAEASPAAAPEDEGGFALQVGSFRDEKNARQLLSDLKERGYSARIMTSLDGEQREWHAVRLGTYKTLSTAARAAADFSGKERIQALVRRSNTL
jgi:DedD protein